ncbi:hypothetical protein NL50_17440 [Clostridium acetobutylicum]|nr:hypothetical protein NL50_17440 [Clostridium acetobutylicum]
MNYVTREELDIALQDIEKIKAKVNLLEEKKADAEVLQGIKSDIKLLNNSIESMKSDRTEDKEMIRELKEEVRTLNDTINNSNIDTAEMKVNQKNIDEKIVDLKADIGEIQAQFSNLSKDIQVIRNSLDNSLWNTYVRLYRDYKFIRVCTRFLIVMFIIIMFSSCFFYVSNGIPWDKIKTIIGWFGVIADERFCIAYPFY